VDDRERLRKLVQSASGPLPRNRPRDLRSPDRFISESEAMALVENAMRASGGMTEAEIGALIDYAEVARLKASLVEEAIRGRIRITPLKEDGEPLWSLPEPRPPRKRGRRPISDDHVSLIRSLYVEHPRASANEIAARFAEVTGKSIHRNTVLMYR
jgi:hypothetical protein